MAKEIRNCMTCECYGYGCEENCKFEVSDDEQPRGSLLRKRKAMKAEKANAVRKSTILVHSAGKSKGQKNLFDSPKKSYKKSSENLEKQQKRRAKRVAKNSSKK